MHIIYLVFKLSLKENYQKYKDKVNNLVNFHKLVA